MKRLLPLLAGLAAFTSVCAEIRDPFAGVVIPAGTDLERALELNLTKPHAWHARPVKGGYLFENPSRNLTATLNQDGIALSSQTGSLLDLNLTAIEADTRHEVAPVEPAAEGNLVVYSHGQGIEQWLMNSPVGLEHGVTLREPLSETTSLVRLHFSASTDTAPEVTDSGFRIRAGEEHLTYTRLVAFDADGNFLPARFEAGDKGFAITVNTANARYPVVVDPIMELERIDPVEAGSGFGTRAIRDPYSKTRVFGAPFETGEGGVAEAGAVYIYKKEGTDTPQPVAKLVSPEPETGDRFGYGISLKQNTLAVGAPGRGKVYIFTRNVETSDNWNLLATVDSPATGEADGFGTSVRITSDELFVGAPAAGGDTGRIDVFNRNAFWTFRNSLFASDGAPGDLFGSAFSVNWFGLVAGVPDKNDEVGAVYSFDKDYQLEVAITAPPEPEVGGRFGQSITAAGEGFIVGSPGADSGTGKVYFYREAAPEDASTIKVLRAEDGKKGDRFGTSVRLDHAGLLGAIIGAPGVAEGSGAVYLFRWEDTLTSWNPDPDWIQLNKIVATDPRSGDGFGARVSGGVNDLWIGMGTGGGYFYRFLVDLEVIITQPDQAQNLVTPAQLENIYRIKAHLKNRDTEVDSARPRIVFRTSGDIAFTSYYPYCGIEMEEGKQGYCTMEGFVKKLGGTSKSSRLGIYTREPASRGDQFSVELEADAAETLVNPGPKTLTFTVNSLPVARNQTLNILGHTDGNLIATDADVSQTIRYEIVDLPAKGRVSIHGTTGAFDYLPDPGATGTDTFTFIAKDGLENSEPATVTLKIGGDAGTGGSGGGGGALAWLLVVLMGCYGLSRYRI